MRSATPHPLFAGIVEGRPEPVTAGGLASTRPPGVSKRLWKRVRAAAIKNGATYLPGEHTGPAPTDHRAAADDRRFHEAIERSRQCDERCLAALGEGRAAAERQGQ